MKVSWIKQHSTIWTCFMQKVSNFEHILTKTLSCCVSVPFWSPCSGQYFDKDMRRSHFFNNVYAENVLQPFHGNYVLANEVISWATARPLRRVMGTAPISTVASGSANYGAEKPFHLCTCQWVYPNSPHCAPPYPFPVTQLQNSWPSPLPQHQNENI